jgi:hypothetical protein
VMSGGWFSLFFCRSMHISEQFQDFFQDFLIFFSDDEMTCVTPC